jgi:uncharacterized membrane protein YkoI
MNARAVSLVCVMALLLGGCCKNCEQGGKAAGLKLPAFMVETAAKGTAVKAKLSVRPDGTIRKCSMYVKAEALPDWVQAAADERVGKGEHKEAEIEQYEDGKLVYEVTRLVQGQTVEVAVGEDRKVVYVEKETRLEEIPDAVKAASAAVAGFKAEEAEVKEVADSKEFEVEGEADGVSWEVMVDAAGKVIGKSREVPAELMLDLVN